MFHLKPSITFLLVWSVTFILVLIMFLKSDYLRTFLITDLLPIKELNDLEKKARRIQQYQMKFDHERTKPTKNQFIHLEENFTKFLENMQSTKSKTNVEIKKSCSAENNIGFIKTHKTASSTLTNILNRFADLRELLVALPAMGDVRFAWPRSFHWSNVDLLRLDGEPANILTNHARYNREQLNLIMEDGVKYITILRDPVTQFESSFYYFEFDRILRLKTAPNPIKEFLKFPDELLYNLTMILGDLPDTFNLIQSGMFYDLGQDFIDMETDEDIKKALKKLESELHLVLIMEYFDESLVLLKHEFCWELDDIFYIKQNQRTKRINLTEEVKEQIRVWNRADHMLYQHFNKTFWKKIKKYEPTFWDEVKEFQARNAEFERACAPRNKIVKAHGINVDINRFYMNEKVDRSYRYICEKVLTNEVDYLTYFRKKFTVSFGYRKLLEEEGLKSKNRSIRLQKRLKSMASKRKPKFLPNDALKNKS